MKTCIDVVIRKTVLFRRKRCITRLDFCKLLALYCTYKRVKLLASLIISADCYLYLTMWARWLPVLGNFTAVLSIHESEKAENHCINSTVINKQIATDTKVFFF
jgi:hypothetical protein